METQKDRKVIPVTGKSFLSQESHSCLRKEISVTGRTFLLLEGNPVMGRNYLWQEQNVYHRKDKSMYFSVQLEP